MAISLDRLRRGFALVGNDRAASNWFAQLWDRTMGRIEQNDADIRAALEAAGIAVREGQNAQSQAATAAATANSAAAGKAAGSVVGEEWTGPDVTWQTLASVEVANVVAGNLRFDTTRLYASPSASFGGGLPADPVLEFRIRESTGAVLYGPAIFTASAATGVVVISIPDTAALDAARPAAVSTGTVTYQLQGLRVSGVELSEGGLADFRVAQE